MFVHECHIFMNKKFPHRFKYKYNEGPLSFEDLSQAKFTVGNCRRAIQDYLFSVHGLYLKPEQILLPDGYTHTGIFITKNGEFDLSLYLPGDIIYAERIKDKKDKKANKSIENIKTENERIINLHSAIFIDRNSIYHATAFSGGTCVWNLEKFNKYYNVVAVKRIVL